MKMRVQSSGSSRPWGFFILSGLGHLRIKFGSHYWSQLLCVILACLILFIFLSAETFFGFSDQLGVMKRRQQGILTGMPFMSNVAPRTFIDDFGRKLYLSKTPKRIVSLAPSITEMLFAIGLNDEIVGVTEFCDFPPPALEKPKVGHSQPNLETLVALQPDLIVSPKSFLRADLLARLEQLKIPTFLFESKTVEDIVTHIRVLGRIVGRVPESLKLSEKIQKRVVALTSQLEGRSRPTLLFVLSADPLISVGPGSYIHQLIELAGAKNAAEDSEVPYPRFNVEEVLRQNPEFLLFPTGRSEGIPQAERDQWRRWPSLEAVKQNNLVQVQSDLLSRPGPRVVEGLEALIKILHPDVLQVLTNQQE